MIRTIIADDEPASVTYTKTLISSLTKDLIVTGTAANGYETIQLITEQKPQLVFLDIDMPGMSGLEALRRLNSRDFEVIFITSHEEFALQAIKLHAADYLLKPIDPAELIISIAHAKENLRIRMAAREQDQEISFAKFTTQKGFIYIEKDKIEYATGLGSYSHIHQVNGERTTVIGSIGRLNEKLSGQKFFRCHNSNLVNLDHVTEFVRKNLFYVLMKSGAEIEVSRRMKEALLDRLSQRSH